MRFIKFSTLLAIFWVLFVVFSASFAWAKSYFVDFGPRPTKYYIDKRTNKNSVGRTIVFVASQAQPERKWYYGHLWVQYETTPALAPKNTFQFGYYSVDQNLAAKELLLSYLNPFGFFFGQKSVEGTIKSDDPWPHHLELRVQIDEAAYEAALIIDEEWRKKKTYTNNPGWGKPPNGCQGYAYAIADAIGLKTPKSQFGQFPAESFVNFAAENGVIVKQKWDFNRND